METNKVPVRTVPSRRRRASRVPPEAEAFYRTEYRPLLAMAMFVGATMDEAEDAVESVMLEMLNRWGKISNPRAYARKAVVSNFIKQKTRPRRLIRRLVTFGEWANGLDHDLRQEAQLTVWEDEQWVLQLLDSLPRRQREAMALIVDEFRPAEVAILLGKNPDAIRQSLKEARQKLRNALSDQISGRKEV